MTISSDPLVSCLCVTRNKPNKLRRAVASFLAQTYPRKELVVVCETDDPATLAVLDEYAEHENVSIVCVEASPKLSLGQLRNLSIQRCKGDYFCQWDDDDWYHIDRVKDQLQAATRHFQPASMLTNWIMYDCARQRAYFSSYRLWEGSVLCRTDLHSGGLAYPDLPRMEDGYFVNDLIDQSSVYPMARPELYVYEVHAMNTWNRPHFDMLFSLSQPLSGRASRIVGSILAGDCDPVEGSRLVSSAEVLGELRYFYVNTFTHSNRQLERYRSSMSAK